MKTLTGPETRDVLAAHGLDRPRGAGFAFRDRARNTFYDWHAHDYHQLVHAIEGPLLFETERGRHFLPSGRAAWIPAGLRHRTLIIGTDGSSLYFAPDVVEDEGRRARIIATTPLMREMLLHARRWPLGASDSDPLAASFFRTLGLMLREWLEMELPLFLPGSADAAIARAMDYAVADPGAATYERAVAAAALSERTFRRRFREETGMVWRDWLTQARMLLAMDLLESGSRVTEAAAAAGYLSMSAFAKAFYELTGETPVGFRQRAAQDIKSRVHDIGDRRR